MVDKLGNNIKAISRLTGIILFFLCCPVHSFCQNISYKDILGIWAYQDSTGGKNFLEFQDSAILIMHNKIPERQDIGIKWTCELKPSENATMLTLTNKQIGAQFSYATLIRLCSPDTLKIQLLDSTRERLILDGNIIRDNLSNALPEQWKDETLHYTTIFIRQR